jgi:hypothetical protein
MSILIHSRCPSWTTNNQIGTHVAGYPHEPSAMEERTKDPLDAIGAAVTRKEGCEPHTKGTILIRNLRAQSYNPYLAVIKLYFAKVDDERCGGYREPLQMTRMSGPTCLLGVFRFSNVKVRHSAPICTHTSWESTEEG